MADRFLLPPRRRGGGTPRMDHDDTPSSTSAPREIHRPHRQRRRPPPSPRRRREAPRGEAIRLRDHSQARNDKTARPRGLGASKATGHDDATTARAGVHEAGQRNAHGEPRPSPRAGPVTHPQQQASAAEASQSRGCARDNPLPPVGEAGTRWRHARRPGHGSEDPVVHPPDRRAHGPGR